MFYNQACRDFNAQRETKMTEKTAGQIREIGGSIERYAGVKAREAVMTGSEEAATSNAEKTALWVKEMIDKLEAKAPPELCEKIMTACGYNCIALNSRPVEAAKKRRRKYPTEEAFLKDETQKPPKGFRFERKGDKLIQYYTPHAFGGGTRCYCSLMRALPEGVNASPTYCLCSRGFVERYWEGILGRKVSVELGPTAISGADECKFVIQL
jgi:hypothetical protein